jgi:MutS domain V
MEAPRASPYAARLAELRVALDAIEARSGRISSLRGVTFLVAAALGLARVFGPVPVAVWVGAAGAAAVFVGLVVAHAVLVARAAALEVRVKLLERGEKRIAGDFAAFPEKGERFVEPGHAYAGDLDVFGAASLFQLVGAVETGAGEETLARWLAAPAGAAEVAERQEAVRELAALPRFREDLATGGAESGTRGRSAEPFLAWAEDTGGGPSALLLGLGRGLVVATVAAITVSEIAGLTGLASRIWAIPLLAQLAVLLALRPTIGPVLAPTTSAEAPFGRYVPLFRLIESQRFQAPRLARLRAAICDGASAARELGRLQTILGFAEVGRAGMFGVITNMFLLWDVWTAAALLRWRARSGLRVRSWIEAMAEIEALAALATFAHEHPSFVFPEVSPGALRFVAEGLGHPLIAAAHRVENDVALPEPGAGLLVTGSNMSGKSTLLRAMGVNAVLALAGAPVCARRLSISVCQVRTSMRIEDSLEEGVSHFYAELGRLKTIVDAVNAGERVIFLLDEVLHGTNSRERNLGAKAVVTHLLARGALGAVSSHDLGLAHLEAETGGRVRNVHFQELVEGGKMTFDYKLKEGVVTSSNALRLMKLIGIAVELPEG